MDSLAYEFETDVPCVDAFALDASRAALAIAADLEKSLREIMMKPPSMKNERSGVRPDAFTKGWAGATQVRLANNDAPNLG
jgi:hypothetical protein